MNLSVYSISRRLFMTKKKEARLLERLEASVAIMKSGIGLNDADMVFAGFVDATKTSKKLGFRNVSEARTYYNI